MQCDKKEIKEAIYAGVCFFDMLKGKIVRINKKIVSFEDKKYLSLYLGLLNSENEISDKFYDSFCSLQISFNALDVNYYKELSNEYFTQLANEINCDTLNNYFMSLLEKEIIKKFNKINNININLKRESNKQLIKK